MIRLILALLATASLAAAAVGDIQSVTIRDEGWTADVAIEGLAIGGTYSSGLGSNNTITGTVKMALTVVSHGYNGTTLTTKTRTVYGVAPMRKPWPDDDENEETNISGTTTIRVILSDLIYDEDDAGAGNSGTAITAALLSGFYTSAGTPTNATAGLTVVNNSTVAFYEAIRNWSWPGWQRMTSATRLRALVFHRHGEQYMPVRAVKFQVTDGTTTNEETVTLPSITSGWGDELPVVEYVTTGDLTTGLTQGAELTWNYIEYPWVGDNAQSTSTGAAAPSPLVGPQKAVCDRTGAYGITHVVVDPVSGSDPAVGSDSGKWVGDGDDPGDGSGVTAYATMGRAARAARDFNAARSPARDDVGGALIYLKAHNGYNVYGPAISGGYGAVPKTWITFLPFPGVDRADVVINASTSGNTDISDRVKFENVTLNISTNNTFSGCLAIWLHRCYIDCPSTGVWNSQGQHVWVTQCDVPQLGQGFKSPSSAVNMTFPLIRGCNLDGFNKTIVAYTVLGNLNSVQASSLSIRDTILGSVAPRSVPIIAFNKFLGLSGTGSPKFYVGTDSANTVGAAIIQNVFENFSTGGGGLATIGSSAFDHHNHMIWHCTLVGQRCFVGYNDDGSNAHYRRGWSMRNNYFDRFANKGDNFNGGELDPPNGNRIGGWPVKFGVGRSGDYYSQNMISIPGNFYAEFAGLSSWQPDASSSGTALEAMFVDRRSATPTPPSGGTATAGLGGGNYDILEDSPLIGRPIVDVVGFDIDGVARTPANTASGAFAGPAEGAPNTFPVVTITSPSTGATTTSPATLTGTATDAEDGTISSSIVWTSDLDGGIGTGASVSPSLSTGTHTITATITDSAQDDDTDTITLTISAPSASGTINATRVTPTNPVRIQ